MLFLGLKHDWQGFYNILGQSPQSRFIMPFGCAMLLR